MLFEALPLIIKKITGKEVVRVFVVEPLISIMKEQLQR